MHGRFVLALATALSLPGWARALRRGGDPFLQLSQVSSRRHLAWWARGGGKRDDFIDVGDSEKTGMSFKKDSTTGNSKNSSLFNGLARLFGQDEQSKAKKAQRKQMNAAIDQMLAGTGVAGGIIGGVFKAVGGMVADAFADSKNEMYVVSELVVKAIQDDGCLGDNVRVEQVFSSASSSSSFNGAVTKSMSLGLVVRGSLDSATVQSVTSSSGGGPASLSQLVLQVQSTGKIINIVGGGGGGGGRPYYSAGRGAVIDVKGEVL